MMLFHIVFLYDDGFCFDYYADNELCCVYMRGIKSFRRAVNIKWPLARNEGNWCTFFDKEITVEPVKTWDMMPNQTVDVIWNWESMPKEFDYKAYNNEQFNEKEKGLSCREGDNWVRDLIHFLKVGV